MEGGEDEEDDQGEGMVREDESGYGSTFSGILWRHYALTRVILHGVR